MGRIVVGAVAGSFGVKGWLKVQSFTDPPENILRYRPWRLERGGTGQSWHVTAGNPHGKNMVVAALQGINTPEQAQALKGQLIAVDRDQLPPPAPGEFYQVDLIGLNVRNLKGCEFGVVKDIMATGANDVLIVQGDCERLIPFLQPEIIRSVDLDDGEITVDWDEDF